MLSPAFAAALDARRRDYNQRFSQARNQYPQLDGAVFLEFLRSTVDPIVSAVAQQSPDRTGEVTGVLYDLALELHGQGFLGPESRYPYLALAWQKLLPQLAPPLAAAPRRVASSITNAVYKLSTVPGARSSEWIESMSKLGAICTDAIQLLEAGKVAAWRAGLAHYRRGALDVCRKLDPALVPVALGLADSTPALAQSTFGTPDFATALGRILDRLDADPWLLPTAVRTEPEPERQFKIVARVGAFRGFGGLFVAPPAVKPAGDYFYVSDGQAGWLLVADIFGATFHPSADVSAPSPRGALQMDAAGKVGDGSRSKALPELANATSSAATSTTLAVTLPLSFSIYLVALVETA